MLPVYQENIVTEQTNAWSVLISGITFATIVAHPDAEVSAT
jgi:hypothetical protein